MNDSLIFSFIRETRIADVQVLEGKNGWYFYKFNNSESAENYRIIISRMYDDAIDEFLHNILIRNVDPDNFFKIIKIHINDLLSEFVTVDDICLKNSINVTDIKGNIIKCETLTLECRQLISKYISVQKEMLNKFLQKFDSSFTSITETKVKWESNKIDIVELSLALYNTKVVSINGQRMSRKDFIKYISSLFGETIDDPNKIINKIYDRDTPGTFLEKLGMNLSQEQEEKLK